MIDKETKQKVDFRTQKKSRRKVRHRNTTKQHRLQLLQYGLQKQEDGAGK